MAIRPRSILLGTFCLGAAGWIVWIAHSLGQISLSFADRDPSNRPVSEVVDSPAPSARRLPEPEPESASEPRPEPTVAEQLQALPSGQETAVDSCLELDRLAETSEARFTFAPEVELNDETCSTAVRILTGQTMPALPDTASPRIPDTWDNHPARRLASEPDDPGWSRPMENRIVSEIQRREGFAVLSLEVVCRSSICGLVFASKDVRSSNGNYNRFGSSLAERLGFASHYGGTSARSGGIAYTYIYLDGRDGE